MEEQYSEELIKALDGAIDAFNGKIPAHQRRIYAELLELLKDLKTKNGRLLNSVDNLKLIIRIKAKLKQIVASKGYIKDVDEFTKAYDEIEKLQNQYFATFSATYRPPAVLEIVKQQSIETAKAYLIEGGTEQELMPKIEEILRANITTGGSYASLTEQLREYIINTDTEGALERYSRQITTDAINQYSASYTATVTADLGLKWFRYVGSLIRTSREFCIKCVDKSYIYDGEIPEIVTGDIDGEQIPVSKTTGLPYGMYANTDADNFIIYRGGYNCGHQLVPMSEVSVPKKVRTDTYDKLGVKYDERGYEVKAKS